MSTKHRSISTVEEFLSKVNSQKKKYWTAKRLLSLKEFPHDENHGYKVPNAWYRGQSQDYPLLPKVYRNAYRETDMLLEVRRRAHLLPGMPVWEDIISWYFILQHHGFPTRLVDWTENPLVALFFAIEKYRVYQEKERRQDFTPVVWMIHPNGFNWVLRGASIIPGTGKDEAISSHQNPQDRTYAIENILAAWTRTQGPEKPLAITGSYTHLRMFAQKSKFTVHGSAERDLRNYFKSTGLGKGGFATCFWIDGTNAKDILHSLSALGISRSSMFPDLDGISTEIDEMYRACNDQG